MDFAGALSMEMINQGSWNALPKDIQDIFVQLRFDQAKTNQDLQASDDLVKAWREKFTAAGIETYHFPTAERAKLISYAEPIWEAYVSEWEAKGARDVLAAYVKLNAEVVAQYPNGVK